MRNFKEKTQIAHSHRSMNELLPWLTAINDTTFINKDGSLMVGFSFEGMDAEGRELYEIDTAVNMLQHAVKMLPEKIMIWATTLRTRQNMYPDGEPEDKYGKLINQVWKRKSLSQRNYVNEHYLFLCLPPTTGAMGFIDSFSRLSKTGLPTGKAFKQAIIQHYMYKGRFVHDTEEIVERLSNFSDALDRFVSAVPDVSLKPLRKDKLKSVCSRLASPSLDRESKVSFDDNVFYLDSMLSSDAVSVRSDCLVFEGISTKYACALTVKGWPEYTFPGITDALLSIDAEITVSQAYLTFSHETAEKQIKKVRTHNNNWRKGIATLLSEAITKTESTNVNNDRVQKANDADEALTEFSVHRLAGHYNFTIMVYGDSKDDLEISIRKVAKEMQSKSFVLQRETIHLLSSWTSTLPGQWSEPVRWVFFMGSSVMDNIHLRSVSTGDAINKYLTEQRQRTMPAVTLLETVYNTPYYFNFHQGDLGHTLVVGLSRSGKSVFNNFLISQFRKYHDAKVYIFDKDFSCRIPTIMQGGEYLDLVRSQVKMNPTLLLDEPRGKEWFAKWIEILLTAHGYTLNAEDSQAIWQGIEQISTIPRGLRRLQSLKLSIPTHLGIQLDPWLGDGPLARFFDHTEDAFSLSNFTSMEMGGLFEFPAAARAFMDYAFHQINKSLDGSPTLIYVEEAWFMLEDEGFAMKINDWLRTLAKRNAILMMATQSLKEIATSRHFNAMIDNIPCKIFLSNPNANTQADLYQGKFGLNDTQLNTIRNLTPKREYYIVTPTFSRKVTAFFPKEILPILDSRSLAQDVFTRHQESGHPNWKDNYYEEMVAQ